MTKLKKLQTGFIFALIISLLLTFISCTGAGTEVSSEPVSTSAVTTTTEVTQTSDESTDGTTQTETTASSTSGATAPSSTANVTSKATSKTVATTKTTAATTSTNKLSVNVYNVANAQGKLAVWFFTMPSSDTHTGDCTLIRTPGGKTMLIDTGNVDGGKMVNAYLDKLGIKKIDVLVITHMHQDHVGGAVNILRHVSVGAVYGTPLKDYNTNACKGFHTELRNKNLTYNVLKTGDVIQLDTKVALETLYPGTDYVVPSNPESDGEITNNSSVVLRMNYGNRSFLFTGDIEMEVEEHLVATMPAKLKCDVLKIPHHGASTSSSSQFVKATGAKYGAIMVYAMNDIFVINRYKAMGTTVHLTSVDGTGLFLTDGNTLQYASEK